MSGQYRPAPRFYGLGERIQGGAFSWLQQHLIGLFELLRSSQNPIMLQQVQRRTQESSGVLILTSETHSIRHGLSSL